MAVAMRAVERALESNTNRNTRAILRQELESELRGLLMAAKMHGFTLMIEHGKPFAIDRRPPSHLQPPDDGRADAGARGVQ